MNSYYSDSWTTKDSFLFYKSSNYTYRKKMIILEFDDCLIIHKKINSIYKNPNSNVEIYSPTLIKKLSNLKNINIVIVSNQISNNKKNKDYIKSRVEQFFKQTNLPIMCIFPIKCNFYMKPHTGSWHMLKQLYKCKNIDLTGNVVVCSNEGGLKVEDQYTSDVDRAFANNISAKYLSVNEFLGFGKEPYRYEDNVICPEMRKKYFAILDKYKSDNPISAIIDKLDRYDIVVVMVMGMPRSGKSILSNKILNEWKADDINFHNAIKIVSGTPSKSLKMFKKAIGDRISVIIDGQCHSNKLRKPYIDVLKDKNIDVGCVYVMDINCGDEMAKLFNHVHLEGNHDTVLYKYDKYAIYRSERELPKGAVCYLPTIKLSRELIGYRF